MTEKNTRMNLRRLSLFLKSKLNGRHKIKAMKNRLVLLLRYEGGLIGGTVDEVNS